MSQRSWIRFGGVGHKYEYCLHIAGCDHNHYIPDSISGKLSELLPGWEVCNRGPRIEITSGRFLGYRHDATVVEAVKQVIEDELQLVGDMAQMKKFALPMLLVADDKYFQSTHGVRFVRCAILRVHEHHWEVKPVEPPFFDERETASVSTAFHMDWWKVSKTDGSAEPIEETFDVACLPLKVTNMIDLVLEEMSRR